MLAKDKTYIYIAVELCDYTLAKWFKQEKVQHLTKEIWRMKSVDLIRDLLCGLEHMHAKRMLHRDLKVGLTCVHFLTFTSQHNSLPCLYVWAYRQIMVKSAK